MHQLSFPERHFGSSSYFCHNIWVEQTISRSNHITFCEKTQENLTKFTFEIKNINWSELLDYNDPNQAYGHFLNKYTDIYNRCFPVKKVNTKKCTLVKP